MAGIIGKKDTAQLYVTEFAGMAMTTISASDKIGHLTTFQTPNVEQNEVDVTDFESEGKETEYGLPDYGELQATQHLTGSEYEDMMAYLEGDTELMIAYYILGKTGNVIIGRRGRAKVKSVSLDGVEVDGVLTVQTTFKMQGKTSDVRSAGLPT